MVQDQYRNSQYSPPLQIMHHMPGVIIVSNKCIFRRTFFFLTVLLCIFEKAQEENNKNSYGYEYPHKVWEEVTWSCCFLFDLISLESLQELLFTALFHFIWAQLKSRLWLCHSESSILLWPGWRKTHHIMCATCKTVLRSVTKVTKQQLKANKTK